MEVLWDKKLSLPKQFRFHNSTEGLKHATPIYIFLQKGQDYNRLQKYLHLERSLMALKYKS